MHDITDLRFFVTITESGSLAEAARRLDVTPSAVSQRLRHLEARLGMALAHRSTRRFVLTEEGLLFRDGVAAVLGDLDRLVENLRERSGEVAGTLNIGGSLGFGRRYLAPAIADFHARHPQLKVALTLSDALTATEAGRFDMIVHIGSLADSSMVAYPVAPNNRFICAAPAYLERRPAPRDPKELAVHDCIVLRENNEDVTLWRFHQRRQEVAVRVPAILSSNDGDVVKQWALAGKGLFVRSEWDVADLLATGQLVRVLPEWSLPNADVVALASARGAMSRRATLFLAFLQARFQPAPPWRLDLPKKGRGQGPGARG
ncbi:LysR family transcriptional regulator [Ramlibacter sp. RBP-2]|uniref:LysR family transcriptional regulator n=1 Tax=Ramlibacter lithotrophicus TaxID=2606681 RepID=A0A7X6DFT6_9BURK|nr:LysR family transcriptional regulator [Ramlibacter lithotrophicus]